MADDNIKKSSSKALAARIVVYRSLGIDKEDSLLCMKELAARRAEGEDFDYESFIEEELKKMPKSEKKMNLNNILKSVKFFKGEK